MATAAKRRLTAREFLALERRAESKSEFIDGEMFAMAGGTRRHSAIAANLLHPVGNALFGGPCQALTSDLRVKIEATGLYTHPAVTVACGILQSGDTFEDVLLNPKILVEVVPKPTRKR